MGTNYYANWRLSEAASESPFSLSQEPVSVDFHICKSLVMFQGAVFNSWSAWKHFLETQQDRVTITDEHGAEWPVEKFVAAVEETKPDHRQRQHYFLLNHGYALTDDWLDPDRFSFHRGEFS